MSSILRMPKLGLTMTEGTLAQWLLPAGARFQKGQPLYVLETEKVANEIESEADGVLEAHLVEEGSTVEVGAPIARWRAVEELSPTSSPAEMPPDAWPEVVATTVASFNPSFTSSSTVSAASMSSPPAARPIATPGARRKPHIRLIALVRDVTPASHDAPVRTGRIIASPYARRLARAAGLDLALVATHRVRITAADVRRALEQRSAPSTSTYQSIPSISTS